MTGPARAAARATAPAADAAGRLMEIKRNIFESSARMPPDYTAVSVKLPLPNVQDRTLPGHETTDHNVVHARSPRIGDK